MILNPHGGDWMFGDPRGSIFARSDATRTLAELAGRRRLDRVFAFPDARLKRRPGRPVSAGGDLGHFLL